MLKKSIVLLLFIGLAGCATYKSVAPTQADVVRGTQKYPGLNLADLNQGKSIFEGNCGQCHSLSRPFNVPASAVEKIMPKMAQKAQLDNKSSDLVLEYILTMKTRKKK